MLDSSGRPPVTDKLSPLMVILLYLVTGGMVGGGASLAVVSKTDTEILSIKSSVQGLNLAVVDIKSEHRSIWSMIEVLKADRISCRSDLKDLNYLIRGLSRHEKHQKE